MNHEKLKILLEKFNIKSIQEIEAKICNDLRCIDSKNYHLTNDVKIYAIHAFDYLMVIGLTPISQSKEYDLLDSLFLEAWENCTNEKRESKVDYSLFLRLATVEFLDIDSWCEQELNDYSEIPKKLKDEIFWRKQELELEKRQEFNAFIDDN